MTLDGVVAREQAAAGVILKLSRLVDVFLQGLQRAVSGDGGELEHAGAVARGAGQKPSPQAVTGERGRIEARAARVVFDDQRHALGREGVQPNAIAAAHLPEHRAGWTCGEASPLRSWNARIAAIRRTSVDGLNPASAWAPRNRASVFGTAGSDSSAAAAHQRVNASQSV